MADGPDLPGLPARRRGAGYRVLVYFGLRDDDALVAHWDRVGVGTSTRIWALIFVAIPLGVTIGVIVTQL